MKTESKNARKLHSSRKFSYDKIGAYHQKFIDKKTGQFHEKYTRQRVCPVCGTNNSKTIFDKSGGRYVKCNECTMIFTNPVFTETALKEYYKNLNTGQAKITANESDFYREIYSMGLDVINKYVHSGSILDIGCSSGFFLDIAREQKWNTFGVELCESDAELCKKRGHLVSDYIVNLNRKFDIITLWDVFEHLPYPKEYLYLLSKHLLSGGIIFIQTPNSNSLASRILREKCNMFDGLEHTNLYNPETINLVAEESGFDFVFVRTVISEIRVINNYLDYEDPYFGASEYEDKVLGFIDEASIHDKLLGYKMQLILKRNKNENKDK